MPRKIIQIYFCLMLLPLFVNGQYSFYGEVQKDTIYDDFVYLSLVDDYQSYRQVSKYQIINKVKIDSLGRFSFHGNNLPVENNLYKIHYPTKDEVTSFSFSMEKGYNFILFIANGTDTVEILKPENKNIFGNLSSKANPVIDALERIDSLDYDLWKNLDIYENKKSAELFYKDYVKNIKHISGMSENEPLVQLMAFARLRYVKFSDSEFLLNDFKKDKTFYQGILENLKSTYPDQKNTLKYENTIKYLEIRAEQKNIFHYRSKVTTLSILLGIFTIIILFLSFLLYKKRKMILPYSLLTKQETKILQLIKEGKTNKEISDSLFVSMSTVKTHINNIYGKLNISSRNELFSHKNK